jgi:hypothetical protein
MPTARVAPQYLATTTECPMTQRHPQRPRRVWMSTPGTHAEDMDHDLEHAGREVGEAFAEHVESPEDPEEIELVESGDDS